MFELSCARKYLTPRWRQLSVSIISMISVLVIALVVWLVVVFFSVTNGLEQMWTNKLVALTAPVRITPTENYYHSYYYKTDSVSADSDYTTRNIADKLIAERSDPYNPQIDEELPPSWPQPDRDGEGNVKDLVKLAWGAVEEVPGTSAHDYEMTSGNLKLRLLRDNTHGLVQSFISQATYLGTFDGTNSSLASTIMPLDNEDLTNIFQMLAISDENIQEDAPEGITYFDSERLQTRLERFFEDVTITALKTRDYGWKLPRDFVPHNGEFDVYAVMEGDHVMQIILPQQAERAQQLGEGATHAELFIENGVRHLKKNGSDIILNPHTPLILPADVFLPASVSATSISHARGPEDVLFQVDIPIQGTNWSGQVPFRHLQIGEAHINTTHALPFWLYETPEPSGTTTLTIPADTDTGDGILLPKTFREVGIRVGDRGTIAYYAATTSSVQEQRIPITVSGFYDPGIMPMGGKFILADREITSLLRGAQNMEDTTLSNGINVRFNDYNRAEQVKAAIEEKLTRAGIAPYWKVETFRDYEFTRDLLQQLRSERNIWSLIAGVIIIVACSNIISMLIILVNDKKMEIGILRSMGATSQSIALIFGTCGLIMGLIGSLVGMGVAFLTLRNLSSLLDLISWFQGYEAFNPMFYGDNLPSTVSGEAVTFVLVATVVTSLIAGVVPAVKASLLRPSAILRSG